MGNPEIQFRSQACWVRGMVSVLHFAEMLECYSEAKVIHIVCAEGTAVSLNLNAPGDDRVGRNM